MKWFKHPTSNYRDNFIQHLIDECGHSGPFIYYTLLEMCAEKLEPQHGKRITEEDCRFVFRRSTICQNTRSKWVTVRQVLGICQAGSEILVEYNSSGSDNLVEIFVPKLAKLLTSDQKKPDFSPKKILKKSQQDLEKEKEKDLEKEYSPKPSQRENSVTKKQIQKTENGSEAAEKKDLEKSPGTTLRQVADVPNPTLAFEARFKNHQDPRRQEFVETIAIMTNAIPQIAGLFNRTRFINEAMDVFSRTSDFDLFADQLIQSVKTQKPKDVRAYASAVWREQITKNRHSPEIELPSLEGIDGV